MDDIDDILEDYAILLFIGVLYHVYRQVQAQPRLWVHDMNLTRRESSLMNRFYQLKNHPDRFKDNFRMTPGTFDYLLATVKHKIQRQDTQMRKAFDPETRLCVTLHFLATGVNFHQLAFMYGLGRKTVSDLVYDCCEAIWDLLQPIYMKMPTTHQEWQLISNRSIAYVANPSTKLGTILDTYWAPAQYQNVTTQILGHLSTSNPKYIVVLVRCTYIL